MTGETPGARVREIAGRYLTMTPAQLAVRVLKHPGAFLADVKSMAGFIVNASPGPDA